MSPLDAARWWIERYQFLLVPVPWMQKGPTLKGWPDLRLNAASDLGQYFNGEKMNFAILMGLEKEGAYLSDIDIDCGEARWAWMEYFLPTGLRWGRRSNPSSHWLYFAEGTVETWKALDPVLEKEKPKDACMIELRCRTKDGKVGNPVVVPPSQHPDDEPYEFAGSPGMPAKVAGGLLSERVRFAAAAAMLGRHLRDGVCHEAFIALAGAMARARRDAEEAQRFLRACYRVRWHEAANLAQANSDVDSTYQRFDDGHETTGLTKLGTLIDERVYRRLVEWLNLETREESEWKHQQAPPRKAPLHEPPPLDALGLRAQMFPAPDPLIEQFVMSPGLTLMVGASKSGKTVLGVQMAMCLACGLHLFDYYVSRQANGLIVEFDDMRAEASLKAFVERSRASRERGQMPLSYAVNQSPNLDFNLTAPEFMPWLRRIIEKTGARFVLLDSYTALRGFHSGKDVVKVEATELQSLNQLAVELKCAFLLIHHTSKTAAHLDRHSRAAGSFAMQAATESQIVVERFRDLSEAEPYRFVSVRGRHVRGLEAVIRFREESLDFDFVFEGPAAEHFPKLRLLLQYFRDRAFTQKEVTNDVGWSRTQVYEIMRALTGSGLVLHDKSAWSWNPAENKTLERI